MSKLKGFFPHDEVESVMFVVASAECQRVIGRFTP